MRQIALFSLALLPALAYGQASTATSVQTTTPAANLQARVSAPPAFNHVDPASSPIASASRPLKNNVTLQFNHLRPSMDGSVSYTLTTDDSNSQTTAATAPVLTHVVNVGVSDLAANNANITVHMTVDSRGVPTHLKVARSAGAELDSKTLAAVSQYRFKPATYDRLPVDSEVTVDVKLQK